MIKIGLVGAGGMGAVHYNNYAHIEGCQVVGIVGNSSQDRQRAEEWNLPLYGGIEELALAEPVDVVDICTPTFLHHEHALQAIDCGKHVIVEKPMALSLADAKEMWAAAHRRKVLLYVAQVVQFTKESQILREIVSSGQFGRPLDACFERLSACPLWALSGWLFDSEKSGLIPYDLHIHDLDLMVSLFGKPDGFQFTKTQSTGYDYPEHYRFIYQYPGFNCMAEAAWFHAQLPFTARWRVYFEKALVVNDGQAVTAFFPEGEPYVYDTREALSIPTGINVSATGMFYNELFHFIDCIQKGTSSPIVREEQVLAVMEVLEELKHR